MPTATLENAPDHAEQQKQPAAPDAVRPVAADVATPGTADAAKPAAPKVAKPAVPDAPNPGAADIAKLGWARQHRAMMIVFGVVLIAVAIFIWKAFFAVPAIPPSIVVVSGRIEGDDSAIAAKSTGRILEVRVREGDSVNAGDTIATLDDEQIRAREQQAQATLTEEEDKAAAAQEHIAVLQEQLAQNRLQVSQSRFDTEGHMGQAKADLATAQSELVQQQAAYKIAAFDKDAYTRLAKTGAVSARQGLQAATTADQQAAVVAASKRRVEAAEGALTIAQASLANPGIRESQVALVRKQIAEQEAEVASATAQTQQARDELAEAEENRRDLTVKAPFTGTVVTRAAEPGEVVTAGTAIITLLDLTKVYLRGFVPEGEIGKVKVGQAAHVFLDSSLRRPLNAYVSRIDPQATFTPENTYFRDDRVKQVVGLKLQLKDGFGFAKPGMPVDGEVLVQGDTWPKVRGR
jgi:HlyD family secretion protein